MIKTTIALMMIGSAMGQGIDWNKKRIVSDKGNAQINAENQRNGDIFTIYGTLHSVEKYKTAYKGLLKPPASTTSIVVYFREPVKKYEGVKMEFSAQQKKLGLVLYGKSKTYKK